MIEHIYRFPTEGKPVSCVQIKSGHINRTYLIETDAGVKYILQWVNPYVFPNIDAIMDNMTALREHLEKNPRGDVPMISYIDTHEGKSYYRDSDGGCWRIYKFVPNSVCLQYSQNIEDFYESAKAFGSFLNAFCDFPAEKLQESIVNFHHTPDRYRQLREALSEDCCGRASQVQRELDYIFSREDEGCLLHRMRENGQLPTRVTHNDTKISNVLLHEDSRRAICVIDLDTVMPGLSAHDFGDAIRYGASTAEEDEPDQSRVSLDTERYRVFLRGYLEACPGLTDTEIRMLPRGAFVMSLEVGIRFLTDYLKGDKYFAISRPQQNLDRCRSQLKLSYDIERKFELLQQITLEEAVRLGREL